MNTFDKHQLAIAKKTLKMSDQGALVMGGMTKPEAREFLKKMGYTDKQITKMEENIINIPEDVRIPGTSVILEKGDQIKVFKENPYVSSSQLSHIVDQYFDGNYEYALDSLVGYTSFNDFATWKTKLKQGKLYRGE